MLKDKIVINIKQLNLSYGILLNRKELHIRAHALFDTYLNKEQFVIHQQVFVPKIVEINAEWLEAKLNELGLSTHDIVKQLFLDKNITSKFIMKSISIPRNIKAAIFFILQLMK